VYVDGETHLSLLAERRIGIAQNIDDAVYVHIGVGISCGILVGGAMYRGANGAAGEIGYLAVVEHAARPADGAGSFEFAAGGGAFARRGQQAAAGAAGAVLRDLAGGDPAAVDAPACWPRPRNGMMRRRWRSSRTSPRYWPAASPPS